MTFECSQILESEVIMANIKEYECRYIFKSVFQSFIHSSLQLLQHDIYCPGQQQVGTRMSSKERCATLMQTDILMLRFQENLYST